MKLVASFSKVEEAYILKGNLQGSGITAYVVDEHIVQQDWFLSNAVGGVKVQVADEDFPAAKEMYLDLYGEEITAARKANKRKHKFSRYLKIGGATFIIFTLFAIVRQGLPDPVGVLVLPSLIVGLSVAALCALLDL